MSDHATIDITEAVPTAVKIPVADLRPTDKVFDIFGGAHGLLWVRHYKTCARFRREDAPPYHIESFGYGEDSHGGGTMTVIREEA